MLFDPETMPHDGDEPQRVAVRVGRKLTSLLQDRTGDGYVLRVDLRLRPSPEVTPIVLPVDGAISYYESSAEPWERAAFIRARPLAGDKALGERFLAAIKPFIWRRAVDFGAITDLHDISHRIRDHYAQGQRFGPGFDLKRGRGGIREIEFFAQIHQLIHGGREPGLRAPATLDALDALAGAGIIESEDAAKLAENYRLFRTIEHRLQMVDDRQTHELPKSDESLDNVAQLHGLSGGKELLGLLEPKIGFVATLYDGLQGDSGPRMPADPELLDAVLVECGIRDPVEVRRRIETWRAGKYATTRSKAAQQALEALLPQFLEDIAAAPDPGFVVNRFDALLAKLPSALNIFRLIEARPGLGGMLVAILAHAPALADELSRRVELFDALIDARALDRPPPLDELVAIFRERSAADDYQLGLERMRQIVGEERFALGVQLIETVGDPLEIAAGYARVAEAAIVVLADRAVAEFEAVHGKVPDSELAILALGRLGGRALTHASDLDLVYLFTGDHCAESDGERPLGATAYYQRLAQRVTAALSVPTAAGPLYEVDTRLRPSGNQGLLAVSLASFEQYHRDAAWTWEHMALARSRPVYGSPEARDILSSILAEILARPRDRQRLIGDVRAMRAEIASHKPPSSEFDVKLISGGLVDLEFCVHFLQLATGTGISPEIGKAIAAQIDAGLLDPDMAEAHELLTRMLVTLRLVAPSSRDVPEPSRALVAKACGASDWQALMADCEAKRRIVARRFAALLEPKD